MTCLTGSLGIPNTGLWPDQPQEYAFIDTKVADNVEYAFHALALDEERRPFAPTIWEVPAGQNLPKVLKQCWFPGVHSNIGGSYDDTELADITLAWMMSQLDPMICFDREYITWQRELNVKYYQSQRPPQEVRPWGLGFIKNSRKGIQVLSRAQVREPGRYRKMDPSTGQKTDTPLENTHECVHASVRVRMGLGGKGTSDNGPYNSKALKGFKLAGVKSNGEVVNGGISSQQSGQGKIRWEYGGSSKAGPEFSLPEDQLGEVELTLLRTSPEVYERFSSIAPKVHS